MERQTTINRPVLLLDRDGYQIETVLVGPHAKYTAWVLLTTGLTGTTRTAACGWAEGYENAADAAFDAYLKHREMAAGIRVETAAR